MGEGKAMTEWTCDRCGRAETLPSSDQPKGGWLAVYLVSPPRRNVCDERRAWLLCPDCDKSIAAWKREVPTDER